ncbi:serine protease [Bacteroidia bacterium]|nr:serine protease [Bacteroidia bacterium]
MIVRRTIGLCFFAVCLLCSLHAQNADSYCFRVYLKDKGASDYSIEHPEAFLSQAAIHNRIKRGIAIDETDLPISPAYLDTLMATGTRPVTASKWFSTVVVESEDSAVVERIQCLPIVDSIKWVWKGQHNDFQVVPRDTTRLVPVDTLVKNSVYGYAEKQIQMLNGILLHEKGYKGQGMTVAVIDAGFMNADRLAVFDSLHLAGTHNVVFPGESVFEEDEHGTKALSCLAANLPGLMVGTAPEATYWLIKSEDSRSEYPIEEDYWTAAVEFADSVGVQVISSSLGYFIYDHTDFSYQTSMLDGHTALISRAAEKLADKGMLLFISAGNEGYGSWEKITFPADARHVLAVGAVTEEKEKSSFSSEGYSADGRVKPDIVALGTRCTTIDADGNVSYPNGTSFSTPTVSGLGICLWQALPWLSNLEIIDLIQKNSSLYNSPNVKLGYGIPDMYKILNEYQNVHEQHK